MTHSVQQHVYRQDGHRQGDHHPNEELEVVAAVDASAFQNLLGDRGLEVGAGDDQVPHGDGRGQQDGPHGVQHAQVAHQQVGGDHAAVKQHGKREEHHNGVASRQVFPGKGIGRQHRKHQVDHRAHHCVHNGVPEAQGQQVVVKDHFVAAQGKVHRPQEYLGREQCVWGRKGSCHNEDKGD